MLLAAAGVDLDAVAAKLEAREGTSGMDEKASRPKALSRNLAPGAARRSANSPRHAG